MSQLPKGWVQTNFDNVIESLTNGISDKQNKESEGIPVTRIETIASEKINYSRIGYVAGYDKEKAKKFLLSKGDILFSHINSPVHLGKTAVFDAKEELFHGTNLLRIVVDRKVSLPSYFNYFCRYTRATGAFSLNAQHAVNQSSLNQKKIKAFDIPLPPLAEQNRIVEKLDEVLARVDTVKARLDGIPAILKRFRQSVLAAAVSGKLTEEWRSHNKELTDVLASDFICKKYGAVYVDEHYDETPSGWGWVKFGSLVDLINGDRGKNYPNKSEYVDEGIPFINTGHIDPNGSLSVNRMNFISEDKYNSLGSGKIQKNDIVYCLRGATMGKTAIVNPFETGAIASSLVIVRPNKNLYFKFAYYFLISPQAKAQIDRFDNGSAQPNLSAKSLGMYPICLPTREEQKEIVRLVDQYFAFADTIEAQVKKAQARVDKLTQSILAKAFRGELVAQDPSDEPAEKLLERIAAARAEAETLAKAVKKAGRKQAVA
ncbi:restriction endonuclease subunit S [Shewanella algae]|uniref:restriction endonuclease subunit S n=1 Tax=Shewanella algae TaxID=38313 RepID=UPI0031F58C13